MKMIQKFTLKCVLVASLFLLVACAGYDDIDFPSELNPYEIELENVRVYTANGEITDPTLINKFINDTVGENIFFTQSEIASLSLMNFKINFLSEGSASFKNDFHREYNVKVAANKLLFLASEGTIILQKYSDYAIVPKVAKYESQRTLITPGSGYDYYTRPVKIAEGDYDSLTLLLFNYKYAYDRGNEVSGYKEQSGIYNEFDEKVLSNLHKNDTIAIQRFYIKMKR